MGKEIDSIHFSDADFTHFKERLDAETALLATWFRDGAFANDNHVAGAEVEAWLIDKHCCPAPINTPFLARMDSPLVTSELASFNVEINTTPVELNANALRKIHEEMALTWRDCNRVATEFDSELVMIGILPSVVASELVLENMSPLQRYQALNEQVLRLRQGEPIKLDIQGKDRLTVEQPNLMLEAATTSLQLHMQVNQEDASRFFNLSKIVSAPLVAISANSPFLFGKALWEESRIPVFEQAVFVGASPYSRRVSFGIRYVSDSLQECFDANRDCYPILLPYLMDESSATLSHLRLHNGTIWRWNRPLIGFDDNGHPHLRIEHRVIPSGPSIIDMVANAALYYGLIHGLAKHPDDLLRQISFEQACANFYAAAKDGLCAKVHWRHNKTINVSDLLINELIPLARQGLAELAICQADIDDYLGVIAARARTGQNGAAWQRNYAAANGYDMVQLTAAYRDNQRTGKPVHEWPMAC